MSILKRFDLSKYSIFLVLIGVFVVAALLNANFTSVENLTNILRQVSVITIMAYGAMALIIGGMIDLSAGSVMAFAGVVSVYVFKDTQSLPLAIGAGLLVGVACNLVSGFFVARFNTPAFIVTLGMMLIARGAVLQITAGQNVLQLGDFVQIGQGDIFGLPLPAIYLLGLAVVTWYLMSQTRFGRSLYAVGGNETAARASGINITRTRYQAYLLNGALVGFAGVVFMSRVNAGLPNAGVGFELQAITAPIIGGTSFSGGIGTVPGTLAGSLIVGLLGNIMNLTGVGSYIQNIVLGSIIMLAVTYDTVSKRGVSRRVILPRKDRSQQPPAAPSEPPASIVGSADSDRTPSAVGRS